MESSGISSTSNASENLPTQPVDSKPFWERSPRKFWSAHQGLIGLKLHEWQTVDPSLPLAKAVSRYVDGLPPDIPSDYLLKITEMVIEAWEKQRAFKETEQSHRIPD